MAKKKQTYKVHEPQISDGRKLAGILASGGLTGQAGAALAQMQSNEGAGLQALVQLIMGALANDETSQRTEDLLFELWKTTEDEQASDADLDIRGRLKAKFRKLEAGEDPGWMTRDELLEKDTPYYRKLQRFSQLPMSAFVELSKALYGTENFADFLESVQTALPNLSTEPQTESNEPTALQPVK